MIFGGDIACPTEDLSNNLSNIFNAYKPIFYGKQKFFNLEGMVTDNLSLETNSPILFNHSSVLNVLKANDTVGVGLANNHTLDLPECFDNTRKLLNSNGILFSGAGPDINESYNIIEFKEDGVDVAIFNYCWSFLLYHQKNPSKGIYVAEINERDILNKVGNYIGKNPNRKVIIYLHWSFDLEILPFPMYRQFARDLIDLGVNAVIGCHSHCAQGGEKYKNGYIVYGLGNFFFPNNVFVNKTFYFPDFSRVEMIFELNFKSNEASCHWFKYENTLEHHRLQHLESGKFESSQLLLKYSPFTGMSDKQYIKYFRKNRRKRLLIPVYVNYKNVYANNISTYFLKLRGLTARFLAKRKLIKWQN